MHHPHLTSAMPESSAWAWGPASTLPPRMVLRTTVLTSAGTSTYTHASAAVKVPIAHGQADAPCQQQEATWRAMRYVQVDT